MVVQVRNIQARKNKSNQRHVDGRLRKSTHRTALSTGPRTVSIVSERAPGTHLDLWRGRFDSELIQRVWKVVVDSRGGLCRLIEAQELVAAGKTTNSN